MRRVSAAVVALTAAALVLTAAPALAERERSFNVSPRTVRAGQQVKAFGKGCNSRAFVHIYLDGIEIDDDRADRQGRFVDFVEIPNSADPGEHRMRASCSGRGLGSVEITVLRSRFNVSPRTVEAGDFIRVSGSGCRKHSHVSIKLDGVVIETTRANGRGKFNKRVQVPDDTSEGRHVVSARCHGRFVGSKSILVTEPYPPAQPRALNVSHSVVEAGQTVSVSGDDCPTKTPTASLDGQPVVMNVDQRGRGKGFSGTVTIPRGTLAGRHRLWAACDAGSEGTTELQVLDADATETAATESAVERQPLGTRTGSGLAIWAGLAAGIALLLASVGVGRRRRS
jgi:hypothetical protein